MTATTPAACLWFVAPGLVHQLGNALFTVQGRARLLGTAPDETAIATDKAAILEGAQRAAHVLQLMRWLSTDEPGEAQPLAHVLAVLADALRVPLRDRGVDLEIQPASGPPVHVLPTALAILVIAACRALTGSAAAPPAASLHLGGEVGPGGGVAVSLTLQSRPGALPFPLDLRHVGEQLREPLQAARARIDADAPPKVLRFLVADGGVSFRPA